MGAVIAQAAIPGLAHAPSDDSTRSVVRQTTKCPIEGLIVYRADLRPGFVVSEATRVVATSVCPSLEANPATMLA